MAKNGRSKRARQVPFMSKGYERKQHEEINTAAEHYVDKRDERMALLEEEVEVYRDDSHDPPLVVTLKPGKEKVKVEEAEPEARDDENDEPQAPRRVKPKLAAVDGGKGKNGVTEQQPEA